MSAVTDLATAMSELERARARVEAAHEAYMAELRQPVGGGSEISALRDAVMQQSADALNLCRLLGAPTP